MLKRLDPTKTPAWRKLKVHYKNMRKRQLKELFEKDPNRFLKFSLRFEDILLDYSKNIIDERTMKLLFELARQAKLKDAIEKMFNGRKINETEGRAVLHTALRNISGEPVFFDGKDVMSQVREVLQKMESFSQRINSGIWQGYTQRPLSDIVNIGIGGSDLGPQMVVEALRPYWLPNIRVHFVSNVDGTHISETLKKVSPQTTLFIISSKSFKTQETMTNASTVREWFLRYAKKKEHVKRHFVAITANINEAVKFGIDKDNIFTFWDWVGGRFSLWSAIGLSIVCAVGYDRFYQLLEGAYKMDLHFRYSPFEKNIPVILALIGIWYINFFGAETEAILPYDQYLHRFPAYYQQVNMESNGKSIDRFGRKVGYHTGPIVWGQPGTNGQHAFFQLLHQGSRFVPCDFIAPAISHNPIGEHHRILLSNFFAQTEALMKGKDLDEVKSELKRAGYSLQKIRRLAPYQIFEGNRPTNSILFKKLTPRTLGMLIAMYEHKIFVQGVIWNIFSFDQWGVELGKKLAGQIYSELVSKEKTETYDSSTNGLINIYKEMIGC